MKTFFYKLLICFSVISLISCIRNIEIENNTNGKYAVVRFTSTLPQYRAASYIYPPNFSVTDFKYQLTYSMGSTSPEPQTFNNYSDLQSATINLIEGDWSFTLKAYQTSLDKAVFEKTISQYISKGESNIVNFGEMEPSSTGKGDYQIDITVNKTGWYQIACKIDGTNKDIIKMEDLPETNELSYEISLGSSLSKGDYRYEIWFYQDATSSTLIVDGTLKIIPNAVSSATYTIDENLEVNQKFTITYKDDSGIFSSFTTSATDVKTSANIYEVVKLPDANSVQEINRIFTGWRLPVYGTVLTEINDDGEGIKKNYELVARWIDPVLYVKSGSTVPPTATAASNREYGFNKNKPYKTISQALEMIHNFYDSNNPDFQDSIEHWTINLLSNIDDNVESFNSSDYDRYDADGTEKPQGVAGTRSITICGVGDSGGGSTTRTVSSVQSVNKSVISISSCNVEDVYLKNLKIIGGNTSNGGGISCTSPVNLNLDNCVVTGNEANTGGGGIYVSNATLKLGNDVVITENKAGTSGGGVYVASGAKLFMYGRSLIGDMTATTASYNSNDSTFDGNYATTGGGIANNGGEVYIGYSGFDDSNNLITSAMAEGYGIRRNVGFKDAGGIFQDSTNTGILKIDSGSVSYNVSIKSNSKGGGIFVKGGSVNIGAAQIISNKAESFGGGVYISGSDSTSYAMLYLESTTTFTANTVGDSGNGGAVFVEPYAKFNIKDSPSISSTAAGNNDVYLSAATVGGETIRPVVNINGSLSGSGLIMNLTLSTFTRGEKLVTITDTNVMTDTIMARFNVSEPGWTKMISFDEKSMLINQPIYVKGSNSKYCTGEASSTGSGTIPSPLASLEDTSRLMDDNTIEYLVYLDGRLTTSQTLGSDFNDKASAITIKGCSGWSGTDAFDSLYGSYSESNPGTMLIIGTTVPIKVENIQIHGGYGGDTVQGGGIRIDDCKANVTLKELCIDDNHVKNLGGAGICFVTVENGTVLNIIDCQVQNNIIHCNSTVGQSGAALKLSNQEITLNIKGGAFQYNKIDYAGQTSRPSINGLCMFLGNKATTIIDGVNISDNEYVNLSGSTEANILGGGIFIQGGNLTIKGNSTIGNGNKATKGGGLYIKKNMPVKVTLESGSSISGNIATTGPDVCKVRGAEFNNNGTVGTEIVEE